VACLLEQVSHCRRPCTPRTDIGLKPVLSKKQETILFLFALSSLNTRQPPTSQIPVFPTSLPLGRQLHRAPNTIPLQVGESGASNASRLKEYRLLRGVILDTPSLFWWLTFIVGASHMHESLLVRDTLYLMQGISGKYVRFSSLKENEKNLVFSVDSVSQNLCNKTRSLTALPEDYNISLNTSPYTPSR